MRHCHSAVAVTAIVGAIVAVGLLRADLDPVQPMGCGRTLRQRDCASVAQPDSSSAFERQRIDFLDMLIVLNFRLRTDDTLPGGSENNSPKGRHRPSVRILLAAVGARANPSRQLFPLLPVRLRSDTLRAWQ